MSNFIIHALPRSRTCWTSHLLTYKDHKCWHEQAMYWRKPEDFESLLNNPNTGTAETGTAQGWWFAQLANPNIRTVVIRRPVSEVVTAVMNLDVSGVATYDYDKVVHFMKYGDRMLDKIEKYPDVLSVDFHQMDKRQTVKQIFEHCLPYSFDEGHWERLKDQNLQIDTKELLRYRFAHKEEIDKFKNMCKTHLRHLRKTDPNNSIWKYR